MEEKLVLKENSFLGDLKALFVVEVLHENN